MFTNHILFTFIKESLQKFHISSTNFSFIYLSLLIYNTVLNPVRFAFLSNEKLFAEIFQSLLPLFLILLG